MSLQELADLLYNQKIKEGWKNVSMEKSLSRATEYFRIKKIIENQ